MRATRNEPHNEIELAALPAILKRSLRPLVLVSAAVGVLAYAGLMLVPSRFTSETQIRVGGPVGPADPGAPPEMAALRVDKEAIQSRVQELRSPDLARTLAREMKLATRAEFNSALVDPGPVSNVLRLVGIGAHRPGETEDERVLAAYYRALQVYQVKDTRVITLAFTARDGELAASAANRLVGLYQQWLRQQGVSESTDTNSWLAPEIEKRTRELTQAEAEVERFRSSANLFRGGGSQPAELSDQQLTELTSELTRTRAQRGEAEARARAARDLVGRGNPDVIPDVLKSPVIQGLIAQRVRAERELAEAASQLLPAHPRMKQLNANVADARRQVQREAGIIVEGLEREAKVLLLREELAQKALDEAKAKVGGKADDRVRLAALEDNVKAKRRELETLRSRLEAGRTRGTTKAVPVEIQVIATARASSIPSWPNRPQIAGLAAAATFVLGLVMVLFRELLAGGQRKTLAMRHEEPSLVEAPAAAGIVSRLRGGRGPSPVPAPEPTIGRGAHPSAGGETSVAEVVERLVGNSGGKGGYRTLVVGASDDLDVREEAVDIAAALSASGRQVVLVDWSLNGEGIAAALGVPSSPGFTDLMAGTHVFSDIIHTLPDGDVHVVPCGSAGKGRGKRLEADRLNLMLDALDEAYADVVVTGPRAEVRELFLAIEGRFDAGVVVNDGEARGEGENRLLGFDVTDIDVIALERPGAVAPKRNGRARSGRSSVRGIAPAAP
jgi:uncharacterized protein involved in exopolysaccharide biosynthesis